MGVPKFFRYISERYPCLSELVKEFQIPDFDNFYLDLNGIIHNCSHPDDSDPYFTLPEEKIFASIFNYIEVLFNIIKPRKLMFLAVDGVAPRAKMNQQRARRFRTAREFETTNKKLIAEGKPPLPENRFDSNCITPGTVFMDRLHAQLQYFITNKISTDPFWQGCKVILSGHQTPGEGEHKIMDYIRYMKTLPDYDPNTRHCLYGLDADLIIIGLCTHEPHFSILREKVFGKKNAKKSNSADTEFYLLHLSLMREYLDLEFQELKGKLSFEYNLENIIDDWVLMGFLVGNDFIPHLPHLHINKGALPILYKAYKEVLPTLDGYLNENGYLNFRRFQKYMEVLGEHDMETFEETFANLAFLEEKTGKSSFPSDKANGDLSKKSDLQELIRSTNAMFLDSDEELEEKDDFEDDDTFLSEFCLHKKNYYKSKLDYEKVTDEVMKSQAEGYIRAIQWNLHYYYQGCQSWSWYYPHHYSPYISDITNFEDLKLEFDMGEPFLPFQQLLAVFPAGSKSLLPKPYQDLLTSPNSPIIDFYPTDFETDLNEKQQDYEAVVLIPFIDEERLLNAMESRNDKLTLDEIRRNKHGPMQIFTYTSMDLGVYRSPQYFPSIATNHALVQEVNREEIMVASCNLKYGLLPGVLTDVLYPGFPTLKHIPHTANLKLNKVQVFDFPSRDENMILTLQTKTFPPVDEVAKSILGKIVYINWPHLAEAKVVAVSDGVTRYTFKGEEQIETEEMNSVTQTQWLGVRKSLSNHYLSRLGVEIGSTDVIIYVSSLDGRKYTFGPTGKITNEKIWSNTITPYPLQIMVKDIEVEDFRAGAYIDYKDAFPINSVVFMLGQPHFGSSGKILDSSDCVEQGRLRVEFDFVPDLPFNLEEMFNNQPKVYYMSCKIASKRVGITPKIFSQITGIVPIDMSSDSQPSKEGGYKINIGLNLKSNKKNEAVPGYTKKENDFWLYSTKAVNVVLEYVEKFSNVIEYLSNNSEKSFFAMREIFPGPDGKKEMNDVIEWVKAQDFNKIERVKFSSEVIEEETVKEIEKMVDEFRPVCFKKTMLVKPHLLYKCDLVFGNLPPVKNAKHKLLDRVVCVRNSCGVPVGLRGYIIGIHKAPLEADTAYDIVFDKSFLGGMAINSSPERAGRLSRSSFINITDADRGSQSKIMKDLLQNCPVNKQTALRPPGKPKTSAFAQFNHQPPKPLLDDNNDQFKQMWSDLQGLKPEVETDALKKILKIGDKEEEEKEKPESEEKEKVGIEDPVKSFFEKATKVSNPQFLQSKLEEVVKIAPPESLNSFRNENEKKYFIRLFSYCQRNNLGQPRFSYKFVGAKVMAQVTLNDGKVYSGVFCDDKASACESAALQILGALGQVSANNEALVQVQRERKIKENQMKLSNALLKDHAKKEPFFVRSREMSQNFTMPPQQIDHRNNFSQFHRRNNFVPNFLPDPPSQWVGKNRNIRQINTGYVHQQMSEPNRQRRDIKEKVQETSGSQKKISASALEFIPLQAITGKRNCGIIPKTQTTSASTSAKKTPEKQIKTEIVNHITSNLGGSPSKRRPRRRPKIAANLALDTNLY